MMLNADDGSKVRNLTKGWTNSYTTLVSKSFEGQARRLLVARGRRGRRFRRAREQVAAPGCSTHSPARRPRQGRLRRHRRAVQPGLLARRAPHRVRGQPQRRRRHLRVRPGDTEQTRNLTQDDFVRHEPVVFRRRTDAALQPPDRQLLEDLLRRPRRPGAETATDVRTLVRHPAVLLARRPDDLLLFGPRRVRRVQHLVARPGQRRPEAIHRRGWRHLRAGGDGSAGRGYLPDLHRLLRGHVPAVPDAARRARGHDRGRRAAGRVGRGGAVRGTADAERRRSAETPLQAEVGHRIPVADRRSRR